MASLPELWVRRTGPGATAQVCCAFSCVLVPAFGMLLFVEVAACRLVFWGDRTRWFM